MATQAISSIQASQLANNNSATDKANLSIQYAKVLGLLENSNFNQCLATVENKSQLGAGVIVYTIAQRGATQNYNAGASKNTPSQTDVSVKLDTPKQYQYFLETNDLMRLGAYNADQGNITVSQALLGEWTRAMALGVQAYLTVKLTSQALAAAKTNTIATITLGSASKEPSVDEYRIKLWRTIAQQVAKFKKIVSSNYIGTNAEDFKIWCSPEAYNDILLTTTTIGSDKAYETLITGRIEKIGGLILVENIFLGQNFAKGVASIDIDEAFDLSEANVIVLHRETLAFPYLIVSAGSYIYPDSANVNNLTKFLVSNQGAVLRPDLIKGFNVVVTQLNP